LILVVAQQVMSVNSSIAIQATAAAVRAAKFKK